MSQKESIQFTIRVEPDIWNNISGIATKDGRSLNHVICLLLHQALKERSRKKRGSKENNPQYYPSDERPGDTR